MAGFFLSLRNRVQSVFMTPRQRARATPLAHRTRATWLERQVTVDSTSDGSNRASATRSGRVPDAGRSLGERRVRRDTSPGVSSFHPPKPISPERLGPHDKIVRRALYRRLQEACRQGYARLTFTSGRVERPGFLSDIKFLEIVVNFNNGMRDLHARFPGLRGVEPPSLSQEDPNDDEKLLSAGDPNHKPKIVAGRYMGSEAKIMFANSSDVGWLSAHRLEDDGYTPEGAVSPKEEDFGGTLAHEYGHHLSSDRVVPGSTWKPKLEAMLRANRSLVGPRGAPPPHANDQRFAELAGKQVRELGIGRYAATNEREFVAEAIAWRMHPDYGRTERAPRMPPILENWVHECFPFLDNGQIPEDSVQFNPGSINEPVSVNGTVE